MTRNTRPPKSLLITGFEPFPGMPINPTSLLIKRLPMRLPDLFQNTLVQFALLPTTWSGRKSAASVLRAKLQPDAILHFGVAGKRRNISIETRAVNCATRIIPDAAGVHFPHVVLEKDAPAARYSTLPVKALQQASLRAGVPTSLSRDAGTYLCNATLWDSLRDGYKAAFVHVPPLPHPNDRTRPGYLQVEQACINIILETARRI
ncbi:MAG: pyroglutamyl-peptidase I [Rhodobacteraceae bacterium]|nr:pyroglutamyl-peptidase I [Paracoccaceae bacterium]